MKRSKLIVVDPHKLVTLDGFVDDDGSYKGVGIKYKQMPRQKPGKSKQDYGTPWEFIRAVEHRFGKLNIDLAGTEKNKKAPKVITPEMDSLGVPWAYGKRLWLNPEFGHIQPWAKKCAHWAMEPPPLGRSALTSRLFFLTPASVGANWFRDHVFEKALVLFLSGRLTFEGQDDPYPKDCILSCYGEKPGFEMWDWKTELR